MPGTHGETCETFKSLSHDIAITKNSQMELKLDCGLCMYCTITSHWEKNFFLYNFWLDNVDP